MQQHQDRYNLLAQKWLNGTITESEQQEFLEWYAKDLDEPLHIEPLFAPSEEELRMRMLQKIRQHQQAECPRFRLRKMLIVTAAAAALIGIVCSVWLLQSNLPEGSSGAQTTAGKLQHAPAKKSVTPGGNKAVLILEDGSELVLDSASNGAIAQQQNVQVIKFDDGRLAYAPNKKKSTATAYNTLATPRGGQYQITLSDGTQVWLNSASSLRFPTVFTGGSRKVELQGEGYFEVAKVEGQPFEVSVNGALVQVLGTHFNIMAYGEEESLKTTLLEGAVRVQKENNAAVLQPGQQAIIKSAGRIGVLRDVSTEEVIAWKNGYFNFEKEPIEVIMRQLARWYNIEVEYKSKPKDSFTGTISRHVAIEKVFQMLELTGAVRFDINGDKVTVRS